MQPGKVKIQPRCRLSGGVTLIELMIVVAILAILSAAAMPSMVRFINDMRTSSATNDFTAALNLARLEAVNPNRAARPVTVCRSANPEAAIPSCANGSDWSSGWIVFVEQDTSATHVVTVANVLDRHGSLPNGVNAQANKTTEITFNSMGVPVGNFVGMRINFNYNGGCARDVVMSRSGMVTVTPDGTPCGS